MSQIHILCFVFFLLLCACQGHKSEDAFGSVLVQIDSKKLYASEVEKIIHDETSSYDSSAIANAYIDRWIKDQLLIRDAHKYLSSNFEIEALVDDYRNQLIKYRYEQDILSKYLDPLVNQEDLNEYYEKYKSNYLLTEPIYKIMFASVPGSTEKIDRLYNAWLNDEFVFIQSFCENYADTSYMGQNEWIDSKRVSELIPKKLIKGQKLTIGRTIQKNINNNEYFLKVLDMKKAKDTIPLELIKEKLERIVLHERKKRVIEDYTQNLYEKGMRSNIVKLEIN